MSAFLTDLTSARGDAGHHDLSWARSLDPLQDAPVGHPDVYTADLTGRKWLSLALRFTWASVMAEPAGVVAWQALSTKLAPNSKTAPVRDVVN